MKPSNDDRTLESEHHQNCSSCWGPAAQKGVRTTWGAAGGHELVFNLKNARTQKHSKNPHIIVTQQPLISVLWTALIADRSFPQIKMRHLVLHIHFLILRLIFVQTSPCWLGWISNGAKRGYETLEELNSLNSFPDFLHSLNSSWLCVSHRKAVLGPKECVLFISTPFCGVVHPSVTNTKLLYLKSRTQQEATRGPLYKQDPLWWWRARYPITVFNLLLVVFRIILASRTHCK